MVKQVIYYEKRVFYAETNFGDITDCWTLDFSTTGQYDLIYNHILIHKYYINMDKPQEIPFEDAVASWYEHVYMPVIYAIKNHRILKLFKNRTTSDLYIYFIKYWDELKQKFGNDFSLDVAAENFKSANMDRTFMGKLKNLIAKKNLQKNLS